MYNTIKLFIKFVKYYPFIVLGNILLSSFEYLFFNTSKIDNFLCWYIGYSYLSLFPFLYLSFKMNFCNYHKLPILILYFLLISQQIFEFERVSETVFCSYYYILISLLIVFTFALSYYLYKHKKPNKR